MRPEYLALLNFNWDDEKFIARMCRHLKAARLEQVNLPPVPVYRGHARMKLMCPARRLMMNLQDWPGCSGGTGANEASHSRYSALMRHSCGRLQHKLLQNGTPAPNRHLAQIIAQNESTPLTHALAKHCSMGGQLFFPV